MTDTKDLSYWIIHLDTGTILYSKTPYHIPASGSSEVEQIEGLDGLLYYFRSSRVILAHESTPEARRFFTELKMSIQEEAATLQQARINQLMEEEDQRQAHGVTKDPVGSAIEAARRARPRPVS